jgi:2-amino-4-hydroxy-6-hydroxymethyldihydropteridine diphosphokinase
MRTIYLGLGSNLSDREENLRRALEALRSEVEIEAISSVYRSEPVGYRDQPDFWNLVIRARSTITPESLLRAVKEIEWRLGRRASFRNAPRLIDIDILLYADELVNTPDLEIPHPRLLERAFALRPLVELDPALRHPGNGAELRQVLMTSSSLESAEPIFPGTRLLDAELLNG